MWKQIRFGDDQGIFGIEEKPEQLLPDCPLIITLAGLGQAMSEKNYFFSNLRKELAKVGSWVIQFDYRGHGDSYGELQHVTISSMVADTLEVLAAVLKKKAPKYIYFVGHALGAVVAQKAALEWEERTKIKCVPVLISPPLKKLPLSHDMFDLSALENLKRVGYTDSQLLVPGSDYYTLSDFDKNQLNYITRLGGHLLYLHGQCLSLGMIEEIDELNPIELFNSNRNGVAIVCGEQDKENIALTSKIRNAYLKVIEGTFYYHQHPKAMDLFVAWLVDYLQRDS